MSHAATLPGLDAIRARFLHLLDERRATVAAGLGELGASDTGEADALRRIQAEVHKVSGTAGTLGLTDLGSAAERCDRAILEHLRDGAPPLSAVSRSVELFLSEAEQAGR